MSRTEIDSTRGVHDQPTATEQRAFMSSQEFLAILKESGALGMWKDRDDIGDSIEFARALRKRAETRHRD